MIHNRSRMSKDGWWWSLNGALYGVLYFWPKTTRRGVVTFQFPECMFPWLVDNTHLLICQLDPLIMPPKCGPRLKKTHTHTLHLTHTHTPSPERDLVRPAVMRTDTCFRGPLQSVRTPCRASSGGQMAVFGPLGCEAGLLKGLWDPRFNPPMLP